MNIYILNGREIKCLETLFSEFARAVDAPDGYFGKSLQSFDDCLFGGFGLETPCQILWENSNYSKKFLNYQALESLCLSIIDKNDFVSEEGKKWVFETLASAQAETKSLFEEVVDLINSVPCRASWEHEIELILK